MARSDEPRLETRWGRIVESLPVREHSWCYSRRWQKTDPSQGWKLHLSATVRTAHQVFLLTRAILRRRDVLFKVPDRLATLAALNSGFVGFSQIGKFLTVYTRSDAEAVLLARELHAATRKLHGPEIPFDLRYRKTGIVFYRYGAFVARTANGADGMIVDPAGRSHKDVRDRAHAVPRWRDDPLRQGRTRTQTARVPFPFGIDLLPIKAITQRGKGGVYEALDLSILPPRLVIVKEGRRYGEMDWEGGDGFGRIKREAKVLRGLEQAGIGVPSVLRSFTHGKNHYLALEKMRGRPLIARSRVHPKDPSWRRSLILLNQIGAALTAIHRVGWVWRDCKPEHIFFEGPKIRLIDFEGACRIEETDVRAWGSPYYTPPGSNKTGRQPGTLEDDYALGVIAFQFGTGKFPSTSASSRAAVYRRTKCPRELRSRIERLLHSKILAGCVK